jgi:hypothetical protein
MRGSLRQIRGKIFRSACRLAISVLAQRFTDSSLGEFVLTGDALSVDPQQHVDAVPSPLRHLSGIDTAVQPRGQASMPEVIRAPGKWGRLLGRGEGRFALLSRRAGT